MKTLVDLDPKPQGGEWYSVLLDGINNGTRVVVVIDKDFPDLLVKLSHDLYTGIGNCKNPILLTSDEAEKKLTEEIKDLELLVSKNEKSFTATFVRLMYAFKKEYFG